MITAIKHHGIACEGLMALGGVKSARLSDRAGGRSWNAAHLAMLAHFHIGYILMDTRRDFVSPGVSPLILFWFWWDWD